MNIIVWSFHDEYGLCWGFGQQAVDIWGHESSLGIIPFFKAYLIRSI